MRRTVSLGGLQLQILRHLWARGEATVTEVQAGLRAESRPLAPTTVATMLKKMEHKGVVAHSLDGRRFVYRATLSEDSVRRSLVDELMESLFDGAPTALVSHLLAQHQMSAAELSELRSLVAEAGHLERQKKERTR